MLNKFDYNKFLSDLNISGEFRVEEDLGNGFVRLRISEAERRQALQDIHCVEDIVVEILRNSRDADSSRVYVATKKIADKKRILYFIDDGCGIPARFHSLIFQSRVTSKLEDGSRDAYGFHGRGMALFSVKLNVEDIKITFSDINRGTCVFVEVDLEKIPEKKDQSLSPKIIKTQSGYELFGGVNNILKIIMDFAVANPKIKYYYGSLTSIVSTISNDYKYFKKNAPDNLINNDAAGKIADFRQFIEKIFKDPSVPLTGFPYYCSNYELIDEVLRSYFNMNLSARSLQRLLYGEIEPLMDIMHTEYGSIEDIGGDNASLLHTGKNGSSQLKKPDNLKLYDESGLAGRFKDEEIKYIINNIKEEVKKIGEKYLLTVEDDIEFKKANNTINFIINLKQKD
jgi:hypothetical protein